MTVKFTILLWKNLMWEKRMWKNILAEILSVILIGTFIVANPLRRLREFNPTEAERKSIKLYGEDTIDNFNILMKQFHIYPFPHGLAYEPANTLTKPIAEEAGRLLGLKATKQFIPNKCLARVTFNGFNGSTMPNELDLKFHFPGAFRTYKSKNEYSNLWLTRCTGSLTASLDDNPHEYQTDLYLREGFLQVQHAIFTEWFQLQYRRKLEKAGSKKIEDELKKIEFGLHIRTFRYDTQQRLCEPLQSMNLFGILHYFLYFLPFLNLIWKYSRECEENMLAHHNRYGCSNMKYWLSHIICSMAHLALIGVLVFILTYISFKRSQDSQGKSDWAATYFISVILLTSFELILSAITISLLIPNAVNAVCCGMLLWILIYTIFSIILEHNTQINTASMIFSLAVFLNNDFAFTIPYFYRLDMKNHEVSTLLYTIAGGAIFKMILLIIVQHLRPGKYKERSFSLPCQPRSNVCKNSKIKSGADPLESGRVAGRTAVLLTRLKKTKKIFRKSAKSIIRKVNMNVNTGEIIAVYGHFSSGKTTFAAMLAGWQKPDNGSILFFDKKIQCAPGMADVSMPNNALFDNLTIYETLVYFINIKADFKRQEQYDHEIENWLKTLRPLLKKRAENKVQVKDLSFDLKRVLALCCVLCCNTRIVILDEPTAHMKATAQRFYWSILEREKSTRAIILTTNSIREAETIGDRVAIFSDGLLKIIGTQMFLRTTMGAGFDLIILKNKVTHSKVITDFLKEYIPEVYLHVEHSDQLVYKLPMDKRSVFQIMLIQLQKRHSQFGITESRIVTSDLSDMILSLGKAKEEAKIPKVCQSLSVNFLPKNHRVRQQWGAMFFKKFKHQTTPIIPLLMCLSSIFLITLLVQLLAELRERGNSSSLLILGFDKNHDRKLLSDMKDCKFIGIQKIEIANEYSRGRADAFTFVKDSFFCSKEEFRTYVKNSREEKHLYGAVSFDAPNEYTLYVNQHIFHSAPLALNLLHNYYLEQTFKDPNEQDIIMRISHDPIPIPSPHATGQLTAEIEHLFIPLGIGVILPMTICSFIVGVVKERSNSSLILMSIAGLRIDIYWFVTFLWDWLTFLIYSIFLQIILILLFFKEIRFADIFLFFLIVNIYSIPLLLSLYLTSMLGFESKYRAYILVTLFHIVSGLFAFVIFWDVLLAEKAYLYVLLLLPTFAMLDGVSNIYVTSKFLKLCNDLCKNLNECKVEKICDSIRECCAYSFFDWGNYGALRSMIFLMITTIILVLLMLWVEIHQRESKFVVTPIIKKMYTAVSPDEESEIVQLRERIANAEMQTIKKKRLVIDQVERNSIIPKKSLALSTISFDVEKKTCFAVYGTNHVGKTNLCRQIVGQNSVRFGDIFVRGAPIKYNVHYAWESLGYSPQSKGVLTRFTVVEILHFFCLIRGVPKGAIRTVVSDISAIFNLDRVLSRQVSLLSMGSQRKISIACAMMATNKVVILDEPTKGLPHWACHEIWKALRYLCSCGKAIVITTTNMYECDMIASKVLLIDDDNMLACGSSHYLRTKKIGFFLDVKLRREGPTLTEFEENLRVDIENLNRFMIFMHSDSVLIYQVDSVIRYYLPVENINFNILYGSLERNRERLNIIEYTVSQGSYEDVLKSFAKRREQPRS